MSLHTVLQKSLYYYLLGPSTLAGIPKIIFDYSNGVQLEGDFIAVDIQSIQTDGHPERFYRLPQGGGLQNEEVIRYRGAVQLGVDVYAADNAIFIAELIKSNLYRGEAIEEAKRQGLGFVNYGDTLNLTATQDGKFRHRAQFNMLINYAIDHTIEETTVGAVGVKGSLDEGKYLIDVTISE